MLLVLPSLVSGATGNLVKNGDFEFAGDDPFDIPYWKTPRETAAYGRIDFVGSERDAALLLGGTVLVVTEPAFSVTTGETIHFQLDTLVVAGRAQVLLEFTDIAGRLAGSREYRVSENTEWTTVTGPPITVPSGALHGRITLASYAPEGPTRIRQAAAAYFDNVVVSR